MNEKVQTNQKIPPTDVIGGQFKVEREPHFKLVLQSPLCSKRKLGLEMEFFCFHCNSQQH